MESTDLGLLVSLDALLAPPDGSGCRPRPGEAPKVCVRFVSTTDEPALLRDQGSDLAVGICGDLPAEM